MEQDPKIAAIRNSILQEAEASKHQGLDKNITSTSKLDLVARLALDSRTAMPGRIKRYIFNFIRNHQFLAPIAKSILRLTMEYKTRWRLRNLLKTIGAPVIPLSPLLWLTQLRSIFVSPDILDQYYLSFENAHRGSNEDITEKLKPYVCLLDQSIPNLKHAPALDIGCGRGEWIDVVLSRGYKAIGVDINTVMVLKNQFLGRPIIQGDAIRFLESVQDNSLSAITAFHVVEHLDLNTRLKLFQESFRCLKRGGFILFETPNPENLIVGACSFYTDPTHINPIPPASLGFMASFVGFNKYEILRSSPMRSKEELVSDNKELQAILEKTYGPQDYAVFARKPV